MSLREAVRSRVLRGRLGRSWYRLWELRQALRPEARRESRALGRAAAPDGWPIPGPRLIASIGSGASTAWYLDSGPRDTERILGALAAGGVETDDVRTGLDFGCGCARMTRCLAAALPEARWIGCDANRAAIAWCRRLPFGAFHAVDVDPPLPLASASVDLAVVWSVFTHLDEPRCHAWIAELARVLAPGGAVVLSTHGQAYRPVLPTDLCSRLDRGELVVQYPDGVGTNLCAAFHPRAFVEDALTKQFDVAYVEEGAPGDAAPQDLYVARRRAG